MSVFVGLCHSRNQASFHTQTLRSPSTYTFSAKSMFHREININA
nr:MAG TPA: hypothetical protein [Caudoviricetes sp.]